MIKKNNFMVCRYCFAICLGLLIYFQASLVTAKETINNIRLWHSPDSTRVVLDVSAHVHYKSFTLQNPLRLVVDIDNIHLSNPLPMLNKENKHIATIRSGAPQAGHLRLVFELKKQLDTASFLLSPNELYGHRLVIDFLETEKGSDTGKGQEADTKTSIVETKLRPVKAQSPAANKPLIIAIDAGHGGEDPGAIGHRGSYEKRITLQIAKKLQATIDADPRMQSYMVRKGDYYIKLNKRRQMARDVSADMFISIHADAFKRKSARGFSVFALSQRGATSAMARALAAKENASDLIGGVSLKDKDDVLAKVLVDLSMTNTISESVNFGGRVLKELGKLGKLHSKRVEQAGFAVLKSPDIPSVLIETGFITNPKEEQNLRSNWYQQRIARGIYTAINEYYKQTPYYANANYASPAIASGNSKRPKARPTTTYHKVMRGDSLSKIAQRYAVSMRSIKKLNKLRNNTVMLGQRLKIPGRGRVAAKPVVHVVKRGDSLSKISAQYNVKMKWIKTANKLRNDHVVIGQKLLIPGDDAVAKQAKKGHRLHKVRRGDTLSEIAEKYKSSVRRIISENNLRSKNIMLGQTLKIPY